MRFTAKLEGKYSVNRVACHSRGSGNLSGVAVLDSCFRRNDTPDTHSTEYLREKLSVNIWGFFHESAVQKKMVEV